MAANEEEEEKCKCKPGLPAWMATFSDLMALLMCFFVLLLSFSELDALKFKRLAGSMRNAFGVQRDIEANAIPKGTSIIAQEFSPGTPNPTALNVIRQMTVDDLRDSLEVLCQDPMLMQMESEGEDGERSSQITIQDQQQAEQVREQAADLAEELRAEIQQGLIEIETISDIIIIRIKEQSFPGGSSTLRPEFMPILDRIRFLLAATEGDIVIEGHTDNLPINTTRYPSNWWLSVARAMSVAEYLFEEPALDNNRFMIIGHGEARPLAENETLDGRSRNRRVEISIRRDNPTYDGPRFEPPSPILPGTENLFRLSPQEIF